MSVVCVALVQVNFENTFLITVACVIFQIELELSIQYNDYVKETTTTMIFKNVCET